MAIVKTIIIKGDTKGAVKSFDALGDTIAEQKQITIEFEEELVRLERQLRETGKSAFNLGSANTKKRIEGLKDAIKDQRIGLKKLNLEQKTAKVTTKDFATEIGGQRSVLTNLSAVTGGYANQLFSVFDLFKSGIKSLKAFAVAQRAAFIATGIGAFVVALGLIVTFWDDIVDIITQVNKKLQENIDLHNEFVKDLKVQLGFNEQILKSLELQGKSQEDQLKIKKDLIKATQLELIGANVLLATQLTREKSKARELNIFQKIDNLSRGITTFVKTANEEELAKQREIADQINANQKSIIDFQLLLNELDKEEEEDPEKRDKAVGIGFDAEQSQKDFEAREQARQDEIQAELVFNAKISDIKEVAAQTQADTAILWADLEAEQKLAIAGAALGAIAQLVDRQSIAGKGIAIAQVGLNTAQGIIKALASSPPPSPLGAIGAAIVGVAGIAQTINIAKQKIPSATGRGFVSGGAGAGAAPPPAPSFNLVEGTSDSQLNDSINLQNQEPVQAFVVSTDVSTSQELDRNIVQGSGL